MKKTNIELAKECGAFAWEENTETPNGCYSKGDCMMTGKQLDATVSAAIEQVTAELRHENANNKAAAELLKHALDKSEAMVAMLRDAVESDSKTYNIPLTAKLCEALNKSAQAAEAYEKSIKAEAMWELLTKYSFFSSQEGNWLKLAIEKDLAELKGE